MTISPARLQVALGLALVTTAPGCGPAPEPDERHETPPLQEATRRIGPDGGTITLAGGYLRAPRDAFAEPVDLTFAELDQWPYEQGLTRVWRITSEEADPALPLEVVLEIEGGSDPAMFLGEGPRVRNALWEQAPILGDRIVGLMDGPGEVFVAEGISEREEVLEPFESVLLDLLFIIDDSCSMSEEQAALASSAPVLDDVLLASSMDFHVGAVSTDMELGRGRLRETGSLRYLHRGMLTLAPSFTELVLAGTLGSENPRGLDALHSSYSTTYNRGFYRDGSQVHAVVLSDGDDNSTWPLATYVDWLTELRVPGDASLTSIVLPADYDPPPFADEQPGSRYLEVTALVGGGAHDTRQATYSEALTEVFASTHGPRVSPRLVVDADSVALAVLSGSRLRRLERDAGWWWDDADGSAVVAGHSELEEGDALVLSYAVP